ncbi:glycosyl transferase family 2 [Methanobacterium lacus]|uniref:Glycosyl transferase family 2 n=1 Tax=Methanobacterium lacus (strain AL-21) TaxID=877455 RepID=F0TBS7_METLA|nr:glycosyltransferase [Methanobacterium lacus]ADZ09154.1 glycosyl transferase family 2 [Methanobacterium lacus]
MNIYWKMVMSPIINEIKPLNIVEIHSNIEEITENLIKYCEDENANLTILNPLKDQTDSKYYFEQEKSVEVVNQKVLEQLQLTKNYDAFIINLTEDYQELKKILETVETNKKNNNFPPIFLMFSDAESSEIPEEHDNSELNTIKELYVDYKDVINDFIRESESELQFSYLEINGNGILYENHPELNELVQRSVDIYTEVENENVNIRNDLEEYKTQVKDLETRVDEVKTEFEFRNNKNRSVGQRIISKFPFLNMIRYIPRMGLKTTLINRKGYQEIKKNNLLDVGYYLNTYADIRKTGKDPIIHYIYNGFKEGRNPSREFDAEYYFENHSDVKKSKLNPLVHYALYGIKENRKTHREETEAESKNYSGEIFLRRADMSIEGCVEVGETEASDIILRIDDENFNLKTQKIQDQGSEEYTVFKFNIPPSFIDEKTHDIRVYDGINGNLVSKTRMILAQTKNFRDLSGFLKNSLVSPLLFAPFREQDKRCFATMEDITKHLITLSETTDNKPLVSVIIPVYNSIKTLKVAIESVLEQTYPNIELVVVDGGSTDGSLEYLRKLELENLVLIQNPDCKETWSARNLGLTATHGEYVAYLNPDYSWDPRYMSAMMGAFSKLEDADALYCGQFLFEENKKYPFAANYGSLNRSLLENRNYIDLNGVCHKQDLYKRIGGFDESLKEYTDWEWIMRMVNDSKLYSIPVLLTNHHKQTKNQPSNEALLKLLRKKQAQRNHEKTSQIKQMDNINNVSIVIPSYESLEDIQECLEALLNLNLQGWVEIIVVDNNSSKAVTDYLTKMKTESSIKLIKNQINYGFTYAVNQGIEIASEGNDILLMNNDAMITPGAIEAMQKAAYKLKDCGLIVPKQILPAESNTLTKHVPYASLNYECDVNLSGLFNNMVNLPLFHSGNYVELSFAPFFCVYIRNDVLKNSVGLDAEYGRHYRSDRMYCNYVRHVMNLKIYHTSEANVYHKLQQSTEVLKEKSSKDYDTMFVKNQWDDELASKFGYKKPVWDE